MCTNLAAGDWFPWVTHMVDEVLERIARRELSAEAALIISVIAGQPVESGSMEYLLARAQASIRPLTDLAEEAICTALLLCHGDRELAAQRLGISRATLYRRLSAYRKAKTGIAVVH